MRCNQDQRAIGRARVEKQKIWTPIVSPDAVENIVCLLLSKNKDSEVCRPTWVYLRVSSLLELSSNVSQVADEEIAFQRSWDVCEFVETPSV